MALFIPRSNGSLVCHDVDPADYWRIAEYANKHKMQIEVRPRTIAGCYQMTLGVTLIPETELLPDQKFQI